MRRALQLLALAAVILGLAAGLYGRIDGFGLRPLAVDEYYFAQSIGFILDQGLPSFPSGGYYVRGPLLQYLTAASAFLLGENEFAFRFPSLLFNLGSILLVYAYGRKVVGRPAALAVAVVLLVSSWHIEFARFARMYSAFQFSTLLFLIAVDDAYVRGNWTRRYLPHLLALIAISTHELGILMTPLLFLPLLTARGRSRFPSPGSMLRFALAGITTLMICVVFQRAHLRNWGVVERLPDGYSPADSGGPLHLPDFPFWSVSDSALVNLGALCGALLVAALAVGLWRFRRSTVTTTDLLAALLVVAAAAHSFVVLGILALVLVFRERILEPGRHPRRVLLLAGLAVLLSTGWLAYGLTHLQALGQTPGGPSAPELLRRAFFGWPDFYIPLWLPFWRDFPLLSVLLLAALIYHLMTKLGTPVADWFGQPTFYFVYFALCFAILRSQYTETRYVFFIYPLILLIIASAVVEVTQRLSAFRSRSRQPMAEGVGAALFACLFLLSSDFNPRHIARVASDEVTYRTGAFERFRSVWYPRLDYRSAAEFVNLHAMDDARTRIVVAGQPPVSYYLERDHAVYYSRDDPRFRNVSRDRGTVELWSDQRLLSTPEDLDRYTSTARVVWIVEQPGSHGAPLDAGPDPQPRVLSRKAAFRTVDGRLQVTRVVLE